MKILIVGTYIPRKCGIATFTRDLYVSLKNENDKVEVVAISNDTESSFPHEVKKIIRQNEKEDYKNIANWVNSQQYDICILQHEFGIFAGEAGNYVLDFAMNLKCKLIINLHTILQQPNNQEYIVIQKLAMLSDKITVMTKRAVDMMEQVYKISPQKLSLIPHGVPTFKYTREEAKAKLGLVDKKVMLSFGLLGRSKGYEIAIEASSKVRDNNFVYIILGATHPNVLKIEGDAYKNSLIQKASDLKLSGKIFFVDHFVSDEMLQLYLKACDIYVTPYPNENQMSSGTLSFALGAGAAVLSTPYWYAKDLLQNDRGCLFGFNNSNELAILINNLLTNKKLIQTYQRNAENFGKTMSWTNVGKLYLKLISSLTEQKIPMKIHNKQIGIIKFLNPGKINNLISS